MEELIITKQEAIALGFNAKRLKEFKTFDYNGPSRSARFKAADLKISEAAVAKLRNQAAEVLIEKQEAMELGVSETSLKSKFRIVDYEGANGSARYDAAELEERHPSITSRLLELREENEKITYKGGRDDFSSMRLPKLETLVGPEQLAFCAHLPEKYRAVAYRYILRGYAPKRAVAVAEADQLEGKRQAFIREMGD